MTLNTYSPFDLTLTLRFILSPPALLNGRVFKPLLDHFEDGEYRRAARLGGHTVLYGVREEGQKVPARLRIKILSGPRDSTTRSMVRALVARQFLTDLDLEPFYNLAQRDPVLSKLVSRFRGMRIPQTATVFECLIAAILEQQVHLAFAHQVKQALIETFGESLEYGGCRYNAFPAPAALAGTNPRRLRKLQISGPKARYIIAISQAAVDGSLDLEQLRLLQPGESLAKLLEHKGVGPWTAQYVGLRALGQRDCLPAADVGLQKALQYFYGLRKQPSSERVEKLARRWAGWRSYATFYLWLTYWETPAWRQELMEMLRCERRRRSG